MSQENVEIVRRCYAALAERDWDGLWRQVDPDFELQTQLQGSHRGPDEAQRFIEDQLAAFESSRLDPEKFFESDDQVVVFLINRARPKGSSAEITIKIAHVWTVRDGRVRLVETFPQRKKALEAAGLRE